MATEDGPIASAVENLLAAIEFSDLHPDDNDGQAALGAAWDSLYHLDVELAQRRWPAK